ncbi:hypothetical protein M062_11340 [Pseudomonas aeruginosa RP73]|nr:hypothetical protein M062_11340 [Pseudomonas aeruginosa RP73]
MTGALRAPVTSGGTTGFAGARYVGIVRGEFRLRLARLVALAPLGT